MRVSVASFPIGTRNVRHPGTVAIVLYVEKRRAIHWPYSPVCTWYVNDSIRPNRFNSTRVPQRTSEAPVQRVWPAVRDGLQIEIHLLDGIAVSAGERVCPTHVYLRPLLGQRATHQGLQGTRRGVCRCLSTPSIRMPKNTRVDMCPDLNKIALLTEEVAPRRLSAHVVTFAMLATAGGHGWVGSGGWAGAG